MTKELALVNRRAWAPLSAEFPDLRSRAKPEGRRATLIAGFLKGNAVVIAADSEEVISDYAKASTQKIRITEYFGNWRFAIAGAGDGAYIDLFEQMPGRRLFVLQQFDFDKIASVIRATLHEAALVACFVPARRASSVDPMTALRCE